MVVEKCCPSVSFPCPCLSPVLVSSPAVTGTWPSPGPTCRDSQNPALTTPDQPGSRSHPACTARNTGRGEVALPELLVAGVSQQARDRSRLLLPRWVSRGHCGHCRAARRSQVPSRAELSPNVHPTDSSAGPQHCTLNKPTARVQGAAVSPSRELLLELGTSQPSQREGLPSSTCRELTVNAPPLHGDKAIKASGANPSKSHRAPAQRGSGG